MKVGLVYHEKFRQYDLGSSHPFKGDRFINVIRFFEEQGIFRLSHVTMLTPQPVTKQDLLMVHNEKYVNLIFSLAEKSKPYDIETPVSPQILEAIQLKWWVVLSRLEERFMKERLAVRWHWAMVIITRVETMAEVSVCLMT